MPGTSPYLIRTSTQEDHADDWDGAIAAAAAMYDPSGEIPEIVDATGHLVKDPAEIIDAIIRYGV